MCVRLPFITLLLLISFASVNAVLFTPALPDIADFFSISEDTAQLTMTWFLIGYTFGQLVYGPLANRFGRKPALYAGIGLQIISSLLCVVSGVAHQYWLLVLARFILAVGSGVGLKMTFTLVNECYEPTVASQKISYLALAFAITPGLGVALGGVLNAYWGWESCFYAGVIYGLILLVLVRRLPETQRILDLEGLKVKHLLAGYANQFKQKRLLICGLLMGGSTSFVYVFAATAPFIAINIFGFTSTQYGIANILPPFGLIMGSLTAAQLVKRYPLQKMIQAGIWIESAGVIIMFFAMLFKVPLLFSLFLPMVLIYFGLSFILANASTLAMSNADDKAHGSAVMNFLNMGVATLVVLTSSLFPIKTLLLPSVFLVMCIVMFAMFKYLNLLLFKL